VYNISAIIVTYFPDEGFEARLQSILNQVCYVVIVDNSCDRVIEGRLASFLPEKIEVFFNSINVGLGAALNQGILIAKKKNSDFVLLLDQDSLVDEIIIENLLTISRVYRGGEIGIIGANSRSFASGKPCLVCKKDSMYMETEAVITSGSLLSLAVYDKVGPFREDFFIECIDLEYCLRLRKYGYAIVSSCQPLMTHAAGKMREAHFWGRPILISDHEPWRYYYMVRNFLIVMRIYFFSEFPWVFRACFNCIKMCIKIFLYEENKISKMKNIISGCKDGMTASLKTT